MKRNHLNVRAVPEGRSYLIAFSGGPDSTMLLHWLAGQRNDRSITLYAAHVNYRLRGVQSDGDEEFCLQQCRRLGIKLFVKRLRKGQLRNVNLQEKARDIRYHFFEELRKRHNIDYVATGHNRDDNVESVLMNLGRGAGSFGLSGIRECDGSRIRPLINLSREEVLSYLKKNNLVFRVDNSNLKPTYLRNKVRLRLIPQLTRVFGKAVAANIHRGSRIIADQERDLRAMAQDLIVRDARTTAGGKIVLDLDKFHLYYPMLQRLVIALCYERLNGSLKGFDSRCCDRALAAASGENELVDLKSGIFAELAGRQLYVYRRSPQLKPRVVRRSGKTRISDFWAEFSISRMRRDQVTDEELRGGLNLRVYFDAAKLRGAVTVRSTRRGDKIRPLGMTGTRKLSDVLIDAKIVRPLRDEIPILLCGKKIFWVVGLVISEEFKVTKQTQSVIMMEVKPYRGT